MATGKSPDEDLPQLLSRLGIEPIFHELISQLCGGKIDYIKDIEVDDLKGRADSNGIGIPPAVARGLIRKLQSNGDAAAKQPSSTSKNMDRGNDKKPSRPGSASNFDAGPCSVSLRRGDQDYASIVRCALRGQLGQDGTKPVRRKVLTAVLDNSGSMRGHWSLVVDAVTKVFTDELLADAFVSLKAIAYNTEAEEVKLPDTSSNLSSLLRGRFSPRGITNFKSAFELAEELIRNEADKLAAEGVPLSAIDVTTLIFTDGADTSVPPLGCESAAATAKARAAGDAFQDFLKGLGCPAYTCIAAFGEYHNPEQCQYLSDRYYYINRREVLTDWLMGGLADLLQSSGYCSLQVQLPSNLSLAEPLPKAIGLDPEGNIEYEIWLRNESAGILPDGDDEVIVCVEESGNVSLRGSATLSSATVVDMESLEGRLFLLDAGEMQLRQIALELRGRRPTPTELARLRERLVGVQALLQPVLDIAGDPKARISGRPLLLARIEELETRRKRLSYTLGHFEDEDFGDTRKIGAVGIDAVLRDVSQRVPLGAAASRFSRRAEASALLASAEDLSGYGRESTFDAFSGCDAKQAADQGDAMFFRLSDVSFSADGSTVAATDGGDQPVAHDVYMLLSNNGEDALKHPSEDDASFTHVGLPFFATSGHFERAMLILPEVLKRLSPQGTYLRGKTERHLLDILGHSLAAQLMRRQASQSEALTLFHKARGVSAVFASTESPVGAQNLLHEVLSEAKTFMVNIEGRKNVKNLYRIAAIGLLAQEWSSQDLIGLGEAVIEESIRRSIARRLAGEPESVRMALAWGFLGSGNGGDGWLDCSLDSGSRGTQSKDFDVVSAGPELEALEESSPDRYSPRDPKLLSEILSSAPPAGTLKAREWRALRELFSRWGHVADAERADGGLWGLLDRIMVNSSAAIPETLGRLGAVLRPSGEARTLRDVISRPTSTLSCFAAECLKGLPSGGSGSGTKESRGRGPPRLELASVINSLVRRREELARRYPIAGAAYPSSKPMSEKRMREIWGASASPVDKVLYKEIRRSAHRSKRNRPLSIREALTDKLYRKQGGRFEFPTRLDTYITGLHRRTRDLHDAWTRKGRRTDGPEARKAAVDEMLLRLPWDDRDGRARAKLSKIVARIWDGLQGMPTGEPIASALWIDEDDGAEDKSVGGRVSSDGKGGGSGGNRDGDDWDVL